MPNFNQAPELRTKGAKFTTNNQYYEVPQDFADILFQQLGNKSAQLRIMLVLVGTKPGFRVAEKWILDRTGLSHSSYITARKALVEQGWLRLGVDAAGQAYIIVDYDTIYGR